MKKKTQKLHNIQLQGNSVIRISEYVEYYMYIYIEQTNRGN